MNREYIKARLNKPAEMRRLLVPEFAANDDEVPELFFTPITPADEAAIARILEGLDLSNSDRNVYAGLALLIQKLKFEDGEPVFERADIQQMAELPSNLVSRLISEISLGEGHYPEAVKKAKKDSGKTGAS